MNLESLRRISIFVLASSLSVGCVSPNQDVANDDPTGDAIEQPAPKTVFLVPISNDASTWDDFAFLAAVAAASKHSDGIPAVIGFEAEELLSAPTMDYLKRFGADEGFVVNRPDFTVPHAQKTTHLQADTATALSLHMAQSFWDQSQRAVIASPSDYEGALIASSLAAKLGSPLLYAEAASSDVQTVIDELKVEEVLVVTSSATSDIQLDNATLLSGSEAVLGWLKQNDMMVDYIAVTNPEDRTTGRSQKLSMVAPILAARRGGIAVPVSQSIPAGPLVDRTAGVPLDTLKANYEAMGRHPHYLAIVGHFDAMPVFRGPSIFDNPLEEQPVSDLPYGEMDADPFLDISIGRIVAATARQGSLIASRISTYEALKDGEWDKQFIEAGLWGFDELRPIFHNVGFAPSVHPSMAEIRDMDTIEVSAILHKDHSYCSVLGHAFNTGNSELLAPAVITSRGCSVGGIDLAAESQPTIVNHLLGQGGVAFLGATRNSIAGNTLIEVSFWNHVFAGQTIGDAFRSGINDIMVHWADGNEDAGLRYSIDIEMLYGDPAMAFPVPAAPIQQPAHVRVDGNTITVVPPEEWHLVQYATDQLTEWNFEQDLFMYVGAGASPRTYWAGAHDQEDLYFGVNIPLSESISNVSQDSTHTEPLGWGNGFHIDKHQDGTSNVLWRVRLLDYDMTTGDITDQMDKAVYVLEP